MFLTLSLTFLVISRVTPGQPASQDHKSPRESETGLLTYNEAIELARDTCGRVDKVTAILNNPLAKMFGLSKLIKDTELPLPRNALDPIGFIAWATRQGLRLQDVVGRIGRSLKRETEFLSVEELIGLLDYPCKQLDFKQSFVENEYVRWLNLGNWTVPLVDYKAERVNVWAVPRKWFQSVFGRK